MKDDINTRFIALMSELKGEHIDTLSETFLGLVAYIVNEKSEYTISVDVKGTHLLGSYDGTVQTITKMLTTQLERVVNDTDFDLKLRLGSLVVSISMLLHTLRELADDNALSALATAANNAGNSDLLLVLASAREMSANTKQFPFALASENYVAITGTVEQLKELIAKLQEKVHARTH